MLTGEIVLRVMTPPSIIDAGIIKAGMFTDDEHYGWKHIKDFKGVQSNPEFTIDIRINSDGYRCKWLLDELKKEKEALKILGIGDSFTFGFGVQEEQCYLSLLEKYLNEKKDRRYIVYNAAVSGFSFKEYCKFLESFRENLVHFDFITIGVTINDHTDARLPHPKYKTYGGYLIYYKSNKDKKHKYDTNAVKLWAYKHSYLWRLAAKVKKILLSTNSTNRDESFHLAREAWDKAISYLDRISEIAREFEIPVMLIRIPHRKDIHKGNPKDEHIDEFLFADLGERLRQYAKQNGMVYVDTSTALIEFAKEGPVYYMKYDAHWNISGHEAAIKAISERADFFDKR